MKCSQITLKTVKDKDQLVSRFTIMQAAYKYGIKGFVQRLESQALIIETEGPKGNVIEFIEWCRRGSEHLKTHEVRIEELPLKNYLTFDLMLS